MQTQMQAIDVINVNDTIRLYVNASSRAVKLAANVTARHIAEKLTTQRAALAKCEQLFDAAHVAKVTATDATTRETMHARCVVLAHAHEVLRENDARALRKTLAVDVARRVAQ